MQGYPPSTVDHPPYSHHPHPSHSYGAARRSSNFGSGSSKERYGSYDEINMTMNMNRGGDLIMNGSSKDQRYTNVNTKGQPRSISGSGPGGGSASSARPRGGFRSVSSGSANSDEQQDYNYRSGPPTSYGFNSRYGNNNNNTTPVNSGNGNGTDVKKDHQFNNNDAFKFSRTNSTQSTHVKSSSVSSVSAPKEEEEEEDLFPDKAQKASSKSAQSPQSAQQQQVGQRKESGVISTNTNRPSISSPVKQEKPESEIQSTTEVPDVENRKELKSDTIPAGDSKKLADESLSVEAADSTVIIHSKPTEATSEPVLEDEHASRGISPFNIQHSSSEESTYTPTIGSGILDSVNMPSEESFKDGVNNVELEKVDNAKVPADTDVDVVMKDVPEAVKPKPVVKEEKVESIEKDILREETEDEVISDDDVPVINGCIFPLTSIEAKYWKVKYCSKSERRKKLKYLAKQRIQSLRQYNFVDSSLLIFKQVDGPNILNQLQQVSEILAAKKVDLTEEFISRKYLWNKMTKAMDDQVQMFHKREEEAKAEEKENKNKDGSSMNTTKKTTGSSRRNRHHGDSVRTEAEFLEILESLEREREKDPLVKAQYGAATIPDMIMNPVKKYGVRLLDTNNLVKDKEKWATRITTDLIDTFTETEHEKFCEAFALWPKKFGKISHFLGGLRTPEECVLHYYRTKKRTNYKHIVANRNKRTTRKAAANKRKAKAEAVAVATAKRLGNSGTHTPESTPTPGGESEADYSSDATNAQTTPAPTGHKRKKTSNGGHSKKRKTATAHSTTQLRLQQRYCHLFPQTL
ncbi:unnamed protein product [Ambrosiozyma monospora]|uniref:Unnamed protein product n=1 Tax=Ambrosiozyma monospora TaxID=43982 RepID=A0ACB5T0C1_AMBMO|nr:unnamed protein product [Ambrosiozyma monospora]